MRDNASIIVRQGIRDWVIQVARRHALQVLARQAGGPLSDEEAMDLTLEARRWARGHSEQRGA